MIIDTNDLDIRTSLQSGLIYAAPPPEPTQLSLIIEALRTIPALEGLTDDEYAWIATHSTERIGRDGDIVFNEGEPGHHLNFILRGEVLVHRRNSGPTAFFIGRTARMTGRLPYSRMKTWGATGYASGSVWVLDLHEDLFEAMLLAIPSMAQRCVSLLLDRVREFTRAEEQAEKLTALGKLAANLAHELNNPASAAKSAAVTLSARLDDEDAAKYQLGHLCKSEAELAEYRDWMRDALDRIPSDTVADSEVPSDSIANNREEVLLKWLEAHEVPEGWTIAPTLAEIALPIEELDTLAATMPPAIIPLAIANFAGAVRSRRSASTIVESTGRIFDLIAAIKDYSYMDQAPIQDVNLIQSLENTLAMLRSRMEYVKVEREYSPDLPTLRAFGSELNQVWTALIENALDAMRDCGTLKLTAKLKGHMVFVEVWDNGRGIDPALTTRIFEPFFTTKPLGAGLGLGLDMVQRIVSKHFGSVSVESKPSATCFQVRLPLDRIHVY